MNSTLMPAPRPGHEPWCATQVHEGMGLDAHEVTTPCVTAMETAAESAQWVTEAGGQLMVELDIQDTRMTLPDWRRFCQAGLAMTAAHAGTV
jgi:phosphoribosylformimino-5-aminoimidazole carboxamide ribonucleotide (ProFAR) isomerase